jgi:hypothetical protein
MTVSAGRCLGPYEVLSPLGAGGITMGESATRPIVVVLNWAAAAAK